ncbi:hypothetical protein OG417_45350 [Actinoallomurus sp. NBC_01490]|uniref:hypothetical protein n=1 Tax=Actinoallomurus sp. NBC_01490 TaxID=2903557 RepID=UPI002E376B2B|nr:hypothetical protein [Actinoallomurus sp. NBC_01490]
MSSLTALARLRAARSGYAEPLRQMRHHHLVDEPLILVAFKMAGEAVAPLACMVGTNRHRPTVLSVPQPRNRDQRRDFYLRLAEVVLPYIRQRESTAQQLPEREGKPPRLRCADAPQIIVANRATIDYLARIGRSTRFPPRPQPGAPDPEPTVELLGRWLTFFADRAEYPGSSLLLPLTQQLSAHWATGQSRLEDENLASLLAWIDPPDGMTGAQAARRAEDPVDNPPAGPVTDPLFDRYELLPHMRAYTRANAVHDITAARQAADDIHKALASQLRHVWDLMWQGVALLRTIPRAPRCERRWQDDRDRFTGLSTHIADGGAPQPARDKAVDAARRLARLEQAQKILEDEQALDDTFVLAERRTTGAAFAGTVVERNPLRQDLSKKGRRVLRPRFTIVTQDPPPLVRDQDYVEWSRPDKRVHVRVCAVTPDPPAAHLITLEVVSGMGSVNNPRPGSVPEMNEQVCYTPWPSQWGAVEFPSREQTPWTHGGPPDALALPDQAEPDHDTEPDDDPTLEPTTDESPQP